jgi:hypothetical protein
MAIVLSEKNTEIGDISEVGYLPLSKDVSLEMLKILSQALRLEESKMEIFAISARTGLTIKSNYAEFTKLDKVLIIPILAPNKGAFESDGHATRISNGGVYEVDTSIDYKLTSQETQSAVFLIVEIKP